MKVKLKNEIVTMGRPGIDPNQCVGRYASPEQWNTWLMILSVWLSIREMITKLRLGPFKALYLNESFREFPEWVEKNLDPSKRKVAMFCTGGIRCENQRRCLYPWV